MVTSARKGKCEFFCLMGPRTFRPSYTARGCRPDCPDVLRSAPLIYAICCFDFGSALPLIHTLVPHSFNKKGRRCWSCTNIADPNTDTLGTLDSATFNPQTTGGKFSGLQLAPFEREKTKVSRDPTSSTGCMCSERGCRNLISTSGAGRRVPKSLFRRT
jgi:hypothetical protein